ncbi:unnamed protein product [Lactuca saligna]|uniref:BZIP domain-containing protein n=1 Tax=Lactuca saligna TaxID=75948 RepID=A0AA35ZZT0_LACSI|nr:unnamed protein product [Lactuca saligna]
MSSLPLPHPHLHPYPQPTPPLFSMKPMDDVWNEISGLPSPTPNRFQDFFSPVLRQPGTTIPFLPPPPSTTTMLTLLTTTNSAHEDPNKRHKPNPPPPPQNSKPATTTPPEYTEKFRRLMKNRESAARSRARKQARADELEQEVVRLAKENAKLKRMQKEVSAPTKEPRLQRTKSAPF